jgi:glycerol kinase
MSYLLALDQGTTSTRAMVYGPDLVCRGYAQRPLAAHFPAPGWVEQDPEQIWLDQQAVVAEALREARVQAQSVRAIGLSNQRETVVLWERRSGRPLHAALVWQDRRTAAACARQRAAGLEPEIQSRTGLVLDPYFSASKLAWLLDHVPDARRRAAQGELAAGTLDSWLAFKLSGGRHHISDATNASRTQLYNLETGTWDDTLLEIWNIPREILPEIVDSSGPVCEASELGEIRAPLAGIAGDQQAALFGQACFEPGEAKCTYGTGCFILQNTGYSRPHSRHRLLATVAWSLRGARTYALEGSVFMGGATVQWLRDGLGLIAHASEVETLAASVPDSDGVVLVPAFTGLGAPWWDADARGLLIGLTRGTQRGHVAQAALDAIALQVEDVFSTMRRDATTALTRLKVDGGASGNARLMQLQADLLGCTLARPSDLETTARGAAALAGFGMGVWPDLSTLRATLEQQPREWQPGTLTPAALAGLRRRWSAALDRARGWAAESSEPTAEEPS